MKYFIIYPTQVVEFENYRQLVNYVISCKDSIFSRIKFCENDKFSVTKSVGHIYIESLDLLIPRYEKVLVLRDVEIVDEFGNNVFTHEFISDVNKYEFRQDIQDEWYRYTRSKKKVRHSRWNPPEVEFRKDPVPYTHHRHRYRWLRHPKTQQERKMSCDTDYKHFFRNKRGKNLPTVYDDLVVRSNFDISWKNCTKNRHQWENKVKCKNKHVDVYSENQLEEHE